ncbi:Bidirectional sugar transporter SWEET10 [Euphorbia peplus]|nr:Bidirectional sugar transporter SWEET10 [Euphorbia peplus]
MTFHFTWELACGVLANVISAMVCLSPLPTFYQICKKKTSEGYQSIPYVIALFSAMLWLFYALFDENSTLLITINSFTFFMEIGYITVYLLYATKKDRIYTAKLVFFFNIFAFGMICIFTLTLTSGRKRVDVLGWICMIFALSVFVAPLGIIRKVIKTKSVEFMPISLSFFLTLSAVMWFLFGFLKKDIYVYIPNVLGFAFGIGQMILYMVYRTPKSMKFVEEPKLQELPEHLIDVAKLSVTICSELNTVVLSKANDTENGDFGIQQVKGEPKKMEDSNNV